MKNFTGISLGFIALFAALFVRSAHAEDSPHVEMRLECTVCHNLQQWKDISFPHDTTGFPLTGRHQDLACRQCHSLENFWNTDAGCRTCHTDVHQGDLGPWCESCHTPQRWTLIDYTKVHANTTFPLLGAHARLDCDACHFSEIEGRYSTLRSDCISCHETEFRSVKSPDHQASGFSTRCEECHSLFAWRPAQFKEHEVFFPIFSGAHAGEWNSCVTCHLNAPDYQSFSCLNCHEHNRSAMDGKHREVSGYMYDSESCLSCHPRGQGGD